MTFQTGIDPFAARKYISVDLGTFTANTQVIKRLFGCPPNGPALRIVGVNLSALTVPLDADGTMLAQVQKTSGGVTTTIGANFDVETMTTVNRWFNVPFTVNDAGLTLNPGDSLTIRFDNNSAAIDTNPSHMCIVEFYVLPAGAEPNTA